MKYYRITFYVKLSSRFNWKYKYVDGRNQKEVHQNAKTLRDQILERVKQEIRDGTRKPEHMLKLSIERVEPWNKRACDNITGFLLLNYACALVDKL